jgi:hypothetical protein
VRLFIINIDILYDGCTRVDTRLGRLVILHGDITTLQDTAVLRGRVKIITDLPM